MDKRIEEYIRSKQNAWSSTTIRSESSRLYALKDTLYLPPHKVYEYLRARVRSSPYSIKTTFIRVSSFHAFLGNYDYKRFMVDNAKLFKYAYNPKRIEVSFSEAEELTQSIESQEIKKVAQLLLYSGLRSKEALEYDGYGVVVGKGGKSRPVFNAPNTGCKTRVTYEELYRELKSRGLTPHMLRKLAATRLANSGFKEADLMLVMGWSSIKTAASYLQPATNLEIEERMRAALTNRKG